MAVVRILNDHFDDDDQSNLRILDQRTDKLGAERG